MHAVNMQLCDVFCYVHAAASKPSELRGVEAVDGAEDDSVIYVWKLCVSTSAVANGLGRAFNIKGLY